MRTLYERAISSTLRSSAAPMWPDSEKPAVMMMTLRTPLRPHCSINCGTVCGRVAMTAISTRAAISSIDLCAGCPCTVSCLGLIA